VYILACAIGPTTWCRLLSSDLGGSEGTESQFTRFRCRERWSGRARIPSLAVLSGSRGGWPIEAFGLTCRMCPLYPCSTGAAFQQASVRFGSVGSASGGGSEWVWGASTVFPGGFPFPSSEITSESESSAVSSGLVLRVQTVLWPWFIRPCVDGSVSSKLPKIPADPQALLSSA